MSRLPVVSSDGNAWGTILNDFLSQAHAADGSLKNLYINVKDAVYGAKGDGSTDDTTAIAAALSAANSAGGGIVYFPFGTYLTGNQTLYSHVILDLGNSTIKLMNGANTDLFSAQTGSINLAASNSSGITGTLSHFAIRNGILDGNKANQTGTSYPLRFYGYNFVLEKLEIKDGLSGGILCDWNGGNIAGDVAEMEAFFSWLKIHNCGGTGLQMGGPHDSVLRDVTSYNHAGNGFHFAPNAIGINCFNTHPYAMVPSIHACGILCEAYGCHFNGCPIEGSDACQLALIASDCEVVGGEIFGNTGFAGIGIQIGQQAGATPYFGQILQSAGTTTSVAPTKLNINAKLTNCTAGAIDFKNDGGTSNIIALINQTSGSAILDTPSATSYIMTTVNGLTSNLQKATQSWTQYPVSDLYGAFNIPASDGNVLLFINTHDKVLNLSGGTTLTLYSDNFTTTSAKIVGSLGLGVFAGGVQLGSQSTLYSGTGAPATGLGAVGDYYFRSDTPSTANQRIYVKTGASTWAGIL